MIYFSDLLPQKFPLDWGNIQSTLSDSGIEYSFLNNTKDIWCRDFMPIGKGQNFIQFKYEPSYLKKDLQLQTLPYLVTDNLDLPVTNSSINLDGGNIELLGDKVILMDRVFEENLERDKEDLIRELENNLQAKCYFVKALPKKDDMTGHIDGYVRWINEGTIMVTDPEKETIGFKKSVERLLDHLSVKTVVMPSAYEYDHRFPLSAKGCYVNYVICDEVVLFPVFGIAQDQRALEVIKRVYPEKKIAPVRIDNIVNEGGLMNCITWEG